MQNNIQVSIIAFAGGVLAGIPTAWILLLNGLILGGLTGLTANYGLASGLWTFVIGHGVIELSVIFMAGGAGLSLGWAIFKPGLFSRRDALMLAARKSIILIFGGALLLIIAGLIEGFISPAATTQSSWARCRSAKTRAPNRIIIRSASYSAMSRIARFSASMPA